MDRAHERKLAKYEDVVVGARALGYDAECIAVEVVSRGLIVESELQQLKDALGLPAKAMTEVALSLFQSCNPRVIHNLVLKECTCIVTSYKHYNHNTMTVCTNNCYLVLILLYHLYGLS